MRCNKEMRYKNLMMLEQRKGICKDYNGCRLKRMEMPEEKYKVEEDAMKMSDMRGSTGEAIELKMEGSTVLKKEEVTGDVANK